MNVSALLAERKLRRRARRYFPLHEMILALPGASQPFRIAQPAFPEALLDELTARVSRPAPIRARGSITGARVSPLRRAATEARQAVDAGGHMPYWGLIWPSGLALAETVLDGAALAILPFRRDTGGRLRALELGCGLGVTATAAMDTGLALTAVDCFPEALAFCRYNTLRNTGRMPTAWLVDWRTESGRAALALAAPYDLVFAADVLYEEPDIAPLLDLAPRLVRPGGRFWLAEPGRRVSLRFVEEALARGWHDSPVVYERVWPPDADYARVTVHQLEVG